MKKQMFNLALAGALFCNTWLVPPVLLAAETTVQSASAPSTMERPQRPPVNPNAGQRLPATPPAVTPIPAYDAAAMLTTFGEVELGVTPTVLKAAGVTGSVVLPPQVQETVSNTVALAGQVSVGAITLAGTPGAAQVAVGSGTISGNLTADIKAAGLGTYSLLLPATAMPADATAALALILQRYPGLSDAGLTSSSSEQGYRFRAESTSQQLDPKTMTITLTKQVVIAGVNGQGKAAVVWAVVGNGEFATALANLGG